MISVFRPPRQEDQQAGSQPGLHSKEGLVGENRKTTQSGTYLQSIRTRVQTLGVKKARCTGVFLKSGEAESVLGLAGQSAQPNQ